MSNRIQPTHFIEVWKFNNELGMHKIPLKIAALKRQLQVSAITNLKTIALFLIRPKTPQEQANSIYYPLNEQI